MRRSLPTPFPRAPCEVDEQWRRTLRHGCRHLNHTVAAVAVQPSGPLWREVRPLSSDARRRPVPRPCAEMEVYPPHAASASTRNVLAPNCCRVIGFVTRWLRTRWLRSGRQQGSLTVNHDTRGLVPCRSRIRARRRPAAGRDYDSGRPTHVVQIAQHWRLAIGEGQRRVALQRRVSAGGVGVRLKLSQLAFQIPGIPEQHVVEELSPRRRRP